MNNRLLLLSVAVIVMGMFAMPSTLSLFSGQHTFKNAKEVANDTGCRKCHEDIYEEMHNPQNQVHWNIPGTKGTFDVFACTECHNATVNLSYLYLYNSAGTRPKAHAAQTVPCLDCHGTANLASFGLSAASNPFHRLANKYNKGPQVTFTYDSTTCGQCHLVADNPGTDTFITSVNTKITGSQEAHTVFFNQSNYPDNQSAVRLKDSNTACVGCHTHTGINVTWVRSTGYSMTIDGTGGSWDMTFYVNTTKKNTTSAGE